MNGITESVKGIAAELSFKTKQNYAYHFLLGKDRMEKSKLTFMLGFFSFRNFPEPVMVPPVPIPETRISTLPSVPFHISGPVVS